MALESRDPTGDTGTGADITDIVTRRLRMARGLVEAVVEAETEITEEAEVRGGEWFKHQPPPHQYGQKTWSGGQNGHKGGRSE